MKCSLTVQFDQGEEEKNEEKYRKRIKEEGKGGIETVEDNISIMKRKKKCSVKPK